MSEANKGSFPPVVQKLNDLFIALGEGRKQCESVVLGIPDAQIRKSILGIEEQSAKYAFEINQHIHILGGQPKFVNPEIDSEGTTFRSHIKNIEKEVLKICGKIEGPIIRLYGKVLRDPFISDGLRQVIRSQMYGIMSSTLQLKLLSKLLYTG